ncbi:unnamed protein product [Blepharisma stoltei]|uniref:Uncharacterized protein n=1 Tax=Blepharisma stoltei TaxID=1481888 RepID=A0AAU9JKR5_9CILI|nr:unnamed protein product [Blepharisma stoltei]
MTSNMRDYLSKKKLKLSSADSSHMNVDDFFTSGTLTSYHIKKLSKPSTTTRNSIFSKFNQSSSLGNKFSFDKSTATTKCHAGSNHSFKASSTKVKGPVLKARDNFDEFYKSIGPSSIKKSKGALFEGSSDSSFSKKIDELFTTTLKVHADQDGQKLSEIFELKDIKTLSQLVKEKSLSDEDPSYLSHLKTLALNILNTLNDIEKQSE